MFKPGDRIKVKADVGNKYTITKPGTEWVVTKVKDYRIWVKYRDDLDCYLSAYDVELIKKMIPIKGLAYQVYLQEKLKEEICLNK